MKPLHRSNFGLIMGLVAAFLVVAVVTLVYGLAGDSLKNSLRPVALHPRAGTSTISPDAGDSDLGTIRNGVHVETGLAYAAVDAKAFRLVRATCTACHSAQLVTQNRATRAGWREMIRWMQATQGLWELGDAEG
ncbi:MAG: hypothetical protein AAFN92_10815, partial [Bacteroidota bacterium]